MENWIEFFEVFTSKVNSEGKRICEVLDTPSEFISDFFEPGTILTSESGRNAFRGRKGIYIFLMTTDVHLTHQQVSEWNSRPSEAGLTSTLEQDLKEGDCLYLGSIYNGSLESRLGQHFGPSGNVDPHGLALSYPTRKIVSGCVKVVVFPLKTEFNQYAPLFVPRIEKVLHNRLRPKAGSSRT